MRFLTKVAVLSAAFAALVGCEGDYRGEMVPKNPNEGDITFQDTRYKLELYAQKHYRGRAIDFMPLQCTPIKRHFCHKVKSIKFEGNNCCFFFPTTSCANLDAGQRIVGDIANTDLWGFPEIGAVKCLSHSACQVMRHDMGCSFDSSCGKAQAQGKCPFNRKCDSYYPVQARDWQNFNQPGWNPVRDRFCVDCHGEEHGRSQNESALAQPRLPLPRILGENLGGSDNDDGQMPKAAGPKPPSAKEVKKQEKAAKKAHNKDEKASRKAEKERKRIEEKTRNKKAAEAKKAAQKAQKKEDRKNGKGFRGKWDKIRGKGKKPN